MADALAALRAAVEGTAAAAGLLPGARIEQAQWLRQSERSEVARVRAGGPGWDGPRDLIVKAFPDDARGWAQESAALAAIPAGAPAPALIAASAVPAVVVMTDAGTGPSLADSLLATGPQAAAEAASAVEEFAAALARLHVSTRGVRDVFARELAERSGGTLPDSVMPLFAQNAARDLTSICDHLGVEVPGGAPAALAGLTAQFGPDAPAALTLADACPDNNVLTGHGYVLIDFEEAEWRHVAWDAAYLTVPWPSCWCSFALPAGVTRRGLASYREVLASQLPYARTDAFDADLALATLGWNLISSSWFLPRALTEDSALYDGVAGLPGRQAVILHRLGDAAQSAAHPLLAEFAAVLRAGLARRWSEVPLELAPAFR